jgi:N-acylneuraminate cytidylyltransferase
MSRSDNSLAVLAIIPARGGSKGVPHKNIRRIAATPLLAYSIQHALNTPDVSRVVVSTDDSEIADIARQYGAEVISRPAELSGDECSSESALSHVLSVLREDEGYEPDLIVFLQPTSPMRQPDDIQNAIHTLLDENADSLFSGCAVHGFVWRKKDEDLSPITYDFRQRQRRQDAPKDLVENGSIYIFKPWVLDKFDNRLGGKIAVYEMSAADSFQVDDQQDLDLIEHLMSFKKPDLLAEALKDVQLLVLDFDGVMTDNSVLVQEDGTESVVCSRGDGFGLNLLKERGFEVIVISTEVNGVVGARCRKLGIACLQACDDKLSALQKIASERLLQPSQIAYLGNDLNDLECLRWVGVPVAVANAEAEVKAVARFVTKKSGGKGAVREVADTLLKAISPSEALHATINSAIEVSN